ncbi:ricin-type beta-trefoil lectin domain protein [Streptomyces sp. PD-S100-1]|uniref:ricin-type beta-trefoil lectin domain protein n=1 Tax=Streptomyces sp. PD-S100-1 TaxID=3394351 RepID=UPI0039BC57BA
MASVLRLGGPTMSGIAQNALNQSPDQLHTVANQHYWEQTPLSTAFDQDRDLIHEAGQAQSQEVQSWMISGLETPGGFSNVGFAWPPGLSDGKDDFFGMTGLPAWSGAQWWRDEGDFYKDPTAEADAATFNAVKTVGTPLYSDSGVSGADYAEYQAWYRLTEFDKSIGADDARLFLSSGGFPRTAAEPDSPEYRIAVEDLKSRFASCAWRTPLDPRKVLGKEVATATAEWQQEIASQAAQRNQILNANRDAVKALQAGATALGELLGQSWTADHLTRWQDYWSPGGVGWIDTSPVVIQVEAAKGMCLDVEGGGTGDGVPVQIYTCNSSDAQKWEIIPRDEDSYSLRNIKSNKCLDVNAGNAANGTKIQIWTCNQTAPQQWKFNVRAAGELRNVATDKCLDLHTYENGYNSWLWGCNGTDPQKFRAVAQGHHGTDKPGYPTQAQFTKAANGITQARQSAVQKLAALKQQLTIAQKAVTASDTAEKAAYAIADTNGAPRGRGLLVGQQKAQITQGAAAALQAMAKAGETAEAATRASAGDSATIAQRALAQAAQSKAEFRKKAAETAESQAKAAADAAKIHRDNAKKDKETAQAELAVAVQAEADAKAAAADAHAKRLAAEAEEKTAKAEKETAAAKQAEAQQHKENAKTQAAAAKDAEDKAKAAEATAESKRDAATKASDDAKAKRDDAWDAEQKANASRAKADAKAAYADSLEAGDAADAARAAANDADQHANDAEAAAVKARSEADAATQAAADADTAATRAEAAAKRSRSDADAAQAAKLKADAAVKTATSAAANALKASQDAAAEAKTAVELADKAEARARDSKSQADQALKEADTARAAAAKAAGFAHVTAQAAVDAGHAATQVADPANDAIQLGSPYVTTDSAAGLVVLTAQGSKTIAEQQKAVADAHAKNAKAEADAAKSLADQAQGDAKEAYQHAAGATKYAADARTYADEALGYAADAADAAAKAATSVTRTVAYDKQATEDAAAADAAAGRAEGYAKDARDSADQAALDAEAARAAATEAEQAAKDARDAATRADAAATEAEQAAKDAAQYAKEAQDAADRAERAQKAQQIKTGTVPDGNGGSIGNVFFDVDHIEKIGDPEVVSKTAGCDHWWTPIVYTGNCTITSEIRYKEVVDVYLCDAEGIDPSKFMCPAKATTYLTEVTSDELTQRVTHNITIAEWQDGVDPIDILFGSWIKCAQKFTSGFESGSWSGCAWATLDVASLFAGKLIRPIADAVTAVDAAARTGIGFADAYKALRILGLPEDAVLSIGIKGLDELVTACTKVRTPLLSRASTVAGGCPTGLIAYNSDELSHMAYRFRTESGYYGSDHNIAVARVPGWNDPKTGDLVIGNSGFDGHSETVILDKLKARGFSPTQITNLYTERQPCPACASALTDALKEGTPITWSVPYHPDFASASKELLAKYVRLAGGRKSLASDQRREEQTAHD